MLVTDTGTNARFSLGSVVKRRHSAPPAGGCGMEAKRPKCSSRRVAVPDWWLYSLLRPRLRFQVSLEACLHPHRHLFMSRNEVHVFCRRPVETLIHIVLMRTSNREQNMQSAIENSPNNHGPTLE